MKKCALTLLAVVLSGPALAVDKMKPGLWELTMKSEAMKNMPKIAPEQAEQMRRMGIEVPQFQDGGMVSKVCVTPQMAQQQAPGLDTMHSGCQTRNFKRSGNSYSADVVCSGDMKGSGKVSGTWTGSDRFSSSYDFNGTMHGQPVAHKQETSGRWLGADCGSVKPMGK